MKEQSLRGVLVPVLTPFREDYSPDPGRFVALCRTLLDQGADGLAVFGTTSEANSMSPHERMSLLEELVAAGIPANKLLPGTGATSITEAARLSSHATALGVAGVLMLPPFYYKGMSDRGLLAFFGNVIETVASDALKVYLYHIPPVAQVPISLDLIADLRERYPDIVVGLKDSSGDWNNTAAVLARFPDFGTFAGSETFLLRTLRGGGMGCITATGNVNLTGIRNLYLRWQENDADQLQAGLDRIRTAFQSRPMIPGMKAVLSQSWGDPSWRRVRPPMMELDTDQVAALMADLDAIGFRIEDPGTL